jgi:hypothetical protein
MTAVGCASINSSVRGPKLTLEATILNEAGEPIEGAFVQMVYPAYISDKGTVIEKETNEEGFVSGMGYTPLSAFILVQKEGYYSSHLPYIDSSESHQRPRSRSLDITLRAIKNPRPLMAKRVHELSIPLENEWIGYDLKLGDWVEPHGKGQHADFLLRYNKEFLGLRISEENLKRARELNSTGPVPWTEEREKETYGRWTADFEIRFPGEDEGIQPVTGAEGYIGASKMKLPHQAPEEGYQRSMEWSEVTNFSKGEIITNTIGGYFLRTRVVKRGGKIVEAHYAKISLQDNNNFETKDRIKPPIQFNPKGKITFAYYFNPDANDRNLEFATEQNLLDVDWDGRVQLP